MPRSLTLPNPFPDIIGKIALDSKGGGGDHQHFDAAMMVRRFKGYSLGKMRRSTEAAVGGALTAAVEPVSSVRLIGTAFYSSGGGRYIANTNLPDLIVNPDASVTLVTTWSSLIGTEIQAGSKTSLFAYYSAVGATRAVATDADGSTIRFGVTGSTTANERIVETTAGLIRTFFRDPKIGGMQLIGQYRICAARRFPCPPARQPTRRST